MAKSSPEASLSLLAALFAAACGGTTVAAGPADGSIDATPIPCGAAHAKARASWQQ